MMKKYMLSGFFILLSVACTTVATNINKVPQQLQRLSDAVRGQYAADKREVLFEVDYRFSNKDLVVKGITTSAQAKYALLTGLKKASYHIIDSLQLLPDSQALERKMYGVVNLSVCNLRAEDEFSSEMVTQALLGMPVKVLQHRSWYRIQTPDNYIAWVHRMGIEPMTKDQYDAWNEAEKIVVTAHYGFTYQEPDVNSQSVSDVVSGNRLKWEGTEGMFYKVSYPDGRKAYLAKSLSLPEKEWRMTLKNDSQSIIQTAYTLMGIPYLWAGTSAKAMDCSGFVRTVLFLHDIIIPRDASQQAYVGKHIDIEPHFKNLQPGDLIFFGSQATADKKERVSHVGIYLGNQRFIHSLGDVHVSSLNPAEHDFDEERFKRLLYATRILPYIDKQKGVNTTLTNPYYHL